MKRKSSHADLICDACNRSASELLQRLDHPGVLNPDGICHAPMICAKCIPFPITDGSPDPRLALFEATTTGSRATLGDGSYFNVCGRGFSPDLDEAEQRGEVCVRYFTAKGLDSPPVWSNAGDHPTVSAAITSFWRVWCAKQSLYNVEEIADVEAKHSAWFKATQSVPAAMPPVKVAEVKRTVKSLFDASTMAHFDARERGEYCGCVDCQLHAVMSVVAAASAWRDKTNGDDTSEVDTLVAAIDAYRKASG